MFRLVIDLVVGINAIAGIVGFGLRHYLKRRRLTHAEYQAQLLRENHELDQLQQRIDPNDTHAKTSTGDSG